MSSSSSDARSDPKRRKIEDARFIPHDIILKILVLIPARYLIQLKRVCKSWLSSLTDPAFISAHTQRSLTSPPTAPLLVFTSLFSPYIYFYDYRSSTSTTLHLNDYIPNIPAITVSVLSADGLLLLYNTYHIHVFNPATKQIIQLPSPSPADCNTTLGFSVTPSTGEYYVVRLFFDETDAFCQRIDIFTKGSSCWRESACLPSPVMFMAASAVSLNGVLYWKAFDMDVRVLAFDPNCIRILSFDLNCVDDSKFSLIIPPRLYPYAIVTFHMEVVQGSLCVVDMWYDVMDVWMREEGGGHGWSRMYNIPLPVNGMLRLPRERSRVFATKEGILLFTMDKELYEYDPRNGRLLKLLMESGDPEEKKTLAGAHYLQGELYTETLAPVA